MKIALCGCYGTAFHQVVMHGVGYVSAWDITSWSQWGMCVISKSNCIHSTNYSQCLFGKWWEKKNSLMGFVYRVVRVLKALWIFFSETIIFFGENCIKLIFSGCPRNFCHRVMYIAPSSDYISLNWKMPFKLILRMIEVVFWCMEGECCIFKKIDGNSFKSTNTILHGFNSM